jgi:hypothetical protein
MNPTEIITLIIALAALVTSAISAIEMIRQSRNAVRPAVVILEKYTNTSDPDGLGRSLYLVNMGNAMAMNVDIVPKDFASSVLSEIVVNAGDAANASAEVEEQYRTEIAMNRRAVLARNYRNQILEQVSLTVNYVDVNGKKYHTVFHRNHHVFGRGHKQC